MPPPPRRQARQARAAEGDLLDLARDLKAAGQGKMLKDLLKRLRATARERITPATRKVALAKLPAGGGLNKRAARTGQRVTARAGRTTATVAIVVPGKSKGSGAAAADRGTIRHPVFGNRGVFVSQKVPPRWFTDTALAEAPQLTKDAVAAIEQTARDAGFR